MIFVTKRNGKTKSTKRNDTKRKDAKTYKTTKRMKRLAYETTRGGRASQPTPRPVASPPPLAVQILADRQTSRWVSIQTFGFVSCWYSNSFIRLVRTQRNETIRELYETKRIWIGKYTKRNDTKRSDTSPKAWCFRRIKQTVLAGAKPATVRSPFCDTKLFDCQRSFLLECCCTHEDWSEMRKPFSYLSNICITT